MRRPSDEGLPFDPDLNGDSRWSILGVISAGGALGGSARYGVEAALPVRTGEFPWATFAVNIAGALLLALLLVLILERWPPSRYLRPFLAIGFLGSFTTFSTWMFELYDLSVVDRIGLASAYLGGSLVGGLVAAAIGLLIGRAVVRARAASRGRG